MEVVIDGVVYVPKEKSELEIMKEKFESGDYVLIRNDGEWYRIIEPNWRHITKDDILKLIHKKHKKELDAWLEDNSVEIEYRYLSKTIWSDIGEFIESYNENGEYRLKQQQYPIFKRNEDGEVFEIISNGTFECVFGSKTKMAKSWSQNEFPKTVNDFETIPYDKERGLYHLQPVLCWGNNWTCGKNIRFYSVINGKSIDPNNIKSAGTYDNIEPITPEQLKTMPFIFDMYKKILEEQK